LKVPPAKIYFSESDRREIIARIDESLASGQLTLGQYGKQLEEYLANYVGISHAVVVNSGTSALEIPLRALGVEGGEVIVPTNTFFATVLSVMHAGGCPRFAELDPETFSIDVDHAKSLVNEHTKGIVIVHIGGIISPRIGELRDFCREKGLFLVEDAAHALGSSLDGQQAGSFGDAASFSFYPTKIVTSGEGGAITTNREDIDAEARLYRDQGKASFTANVHGRLGYNWRMSEPHAIIGLTHCQRLDEFVAERQKIARFYDEALADIEGVEPLLLPEGCSSNYYKYIANIEDWVDRAALKQVIRGEFDIGLSGEVYERPVHLQPYFEGIYSEGMLPKAERACARHICLPVFQGLGEDDCQQVVDALSIALQKQHSLA
jgi:perosamine synthetase